MRGVERDADLGGHRGRPSLDLATTVKIEHVAARGHCQRDHDQRAAEADRRDWPDQVLQHVVLEFDLVPHELDAGLDVAVGLIDGAADLEPVDDLEVSCCMWNW